MLRENAAAPRAGLKAAPGGAAGKALDSESRSHLSECAQSLGEALRAGI